MIKTITKCRICGNTDLEFCIDLGEQVLTGFFPRPQDKPLAKGPLELVKCKDKDQSTCGLLQMRHSYDMKELYEDHYGYRSSLNQSMVDHLRDIVSKILKIVRVGPQDIVLDIGINSRIACLLRHVMLKLDRYISATAGPVAPSMIPYRRPLA